MTRRGCRVLLLALLALVLAGPARAAEKLVPAVFRSLTDAHGFAYTCDAHGRVQTQYGWLYSGFQINRSNMGAQRRLMTPSGDEYVLEGRIGVLAIQRRFKVDRKLGGVRVTEILHNTSPTPQAASVIVYAQLNYRYTQVVTDRGRPLGGGPLVRKEVGIAGLLNAPVQGLTVYHLTGARSKVRPLIVNGNNQQLQFQYNVSVPARARVALVHGGAILRQRGTPAANQVDRHFKPFRSRRWLADLPGEVRRALVNRSAGSAEGDDLSLEQVLDIAPAGQDQLVFSERTRLQGTATCTRLEVHTAHGRVRVPFEQVAAIVGRRHATLEPRVHLRDGQKLVGRMDAEGLRFEMTSGMAVDLDIEKLDRLVLRARAPGADAGEVATGPAEEGVAYLVETFDGNRLLARKRTESLHAATAWGRLEVPVEALRRVHLAGEDHPGYWIELTDGSRFRAFLRDRPLEMQSRLFEAVTFRPHQIRRITALRPKRPEGAAAEVEVVLPHLVLVGGDTLVGRIDLDAVHFLAPGGVLPQPPSQIRVLHNELEGETPDPGQVPTFRAEIWGGGHITGELRELVLPVRTARGVLQVPAQDLVEVHVPTPIVPEALRVRLRALIRDLGHASWEKREAASTALEDLGELARRALEQALQETKDPEVERRARRLLDKL